MGMKKSYILIILISFLVISPKLYAQVECPCDFESVPKDKGCWTEQFSGEPVYTTDQSCLVVNAGDTGTLALLVNQQQSFCSTKNTIGLARCGPSTGTSNLTPEELKACQCELQAYVTALNDVDGITVSGGPPYTCGDVDCPSPIIKTPIPTISEWGLLAMAGVLGIVGFMVIRRRKATA